MSRDVTVHIDHLVIDGAGPIDRERLAGAVREELGRLVAAGGLHPAGGVHAALDAGTVTPGTDPSREVGRRVAGAVHGVLGGKR